MAQPPLQIVLLGGSGFVGRAVLRHIARSNGDQVRVHALLRRPDAVPDYPFLRKVEGSLERFPEQLEPDAPYVLVHFAVKHIDRDGTGFHAVNVEATQRLLGTLGPQLRGVVYGSSLAVFGRGAQVDVRETAVARPDTALARSRYEAEQTITEDASERGISALLLRPRFVIGQGDAFVMPGLAKVARRGVGVASGSQRFSVIDVDDYARVILRLAARVIERDVAGTPLRTAFHVGYTRPVPYGELEDALVDALDLPKPWLRVPASLRIGSLVRRLVPTRGGDQLATRLELVGLSHWADTSALGAELRSSLLEQDPLPAVRRAARALAGHEPVLENLQPSSSQS